MPLLDEQIVTCSPDVASRVLDGEAVLLDLVSGKYFGLDPVGSRVWELLAGGARVGELRAALLREYDAPEAVLAQDLDDLLGTLERRGLVRFE